MHLNSSAFLPEQVYENLLKEIINQKWLVGDKLPSEKALSIEYGVSRVSVRSAIQRLQSEKLVTTKAGRGSFVISNTENDFQQIMKKMDLSENEFRYVVELRQAIEFTSIDLVSKYGEEAEFQKIKSAVEKMSSCASDLNGYIQADYAFHHAIIEGSRNPLFVAVINNCEKIILRYLTEMARVSDEKLDRAIENHKGIYEAIVSRDSKRAKNIIKNSFKYNLNRFKGVFKENANEDNSN